MCLDIEEEGAHNGIIQSGTHGGPLTFVKPRNLRVTISFVLIRIDSAKRVHDLKTSVVSKFCINNGRVGS